jgi:hypothetical protein
MLEVNPDEMQIIVLEIVESAKVKHEEDSYLPTGYYRTNISLWTTKLREY